MALPFFYEPAVNGTESTVTLGEETSRHCVQVLRMKTGEQLRLTDGKGKLHTATILSGDKKHMAVQINESVSVPAPGIKTTIAISLLKNAARFEWFLEKATEIGVTGIRPLICARTEHTRFRNERMQGILVAAMLQSQQAWLPALAEPVAFMDFMQEPVAPAQKLIAHCEDGTKRLVKDLPPSADTLMLIGPEGDFTPAEIALAMQQGFTGVSLGATRLRTETAGMVGAALLLNR